MPGVDAACALFLSHALVRSRYLGSRVLPNASSIFPSASPSSAAGDAGPQGAAIPATHDRFAPRNAEVDATTQADRASSARLASPRSLPLILDLCPSGERVESGPANRWPGKPDPRLRCRGPGPGLRPGEEADDEAPDRRQHIHYIWPGDRVILVLAPDLLRRRAASWERFGASEGARRLAGSASPPCR